MTVIAIADDDEGVRRALSSLLRSSGYVVTAFASGEEFLRSEDKLITSCLVTDLRMPGMSGIDLQEALRSEGHLYPVIFITAFAAPHIEARAREAGAAAFLSKPFPAEVLLTAIETALAGRGSEA